jgi:hypothetical protein
LQEIRARVAAGEDIHLCSECKGIAEEDIPECKCTNYGCCDIWQYGDVDEEPCEFCWSYTCSVCSRPLPQDCASTI